MKNWLGGLSLVLFGMLLSAILFLVTSPPRGHSIELLPAPTPSPLIVQVDGAVAQPGVYHLPRDSRVGEAIAAAGGLSTTADQSAINLAERLKDGEKIFIPILNPHPTPGSVGPSSNNPSRSTISPGEPTPVNINEASLEELEKLPGIGSSRAQQIIDYRQAHDGFKSPDELLNIKGIGPVIFDQLKDLITIE